MVSTAPWQTAINGGFFICSFVTSFKRFPLAGQYHTICKQMKATFISFKVWLCCLLMNNGDSFDVDYGDISLHYLSDARFPVLSGFHYCQVKRLAVGNVTSVVGSYWGHI